MDEWPSWAIGKLFEMLRDLALVQEDGNLLGSRTKQCEHCPTECEIVVRVATAERKWTCTVTRWSDLRAASTVNRPFGERTWTFWIHARWTLHKFKRQYQLCVIGSNRKMETHGNEHISERLSAARSRGKHGTHTCENLEYRGLKQLSSARYPDIGVLPHHQLI